MVALQLILFLGGWLFLIKIMPTQMYLQKIFLLINLVVLGIGYLSYGVLELQYDEDFSFYNNKSGLDALLSSVYKFVICNSLMAASFFLFRIVNWKPSVIHNKSKSQIKVGIYSIYLALFSVITLAIGHGFMELFDRFEYLTVDFPPLFAAGQVFTLVSCFVLGLSSSTEENIFRKVLYTFAFLIIEVVYFSLATRLFALGALVYYSGRRYNKFSAGSINFYELIGFGFLIVYLQAIPLFLRDSEKHGLITYVAMLFSTNSIEIFSLNPVKQFLLNFSFGIPLLQDVVDRNLFRFSDFWMAVNPLPGSWIGWYELAPELRVSEYIPFNLYGEFYSLELFDMCLAFLYLGFLISLLNEFYIKLRNLGFDVSAFLMSILLVGFSVLATQYNSRMAIRFLYYGLFIYFGISVFIRFRKIKKAINHESF